MQRQLRWALTGVALVAAACSNGPRKGFDTMGAGATPGVSGGRPGPASAAGSVSPTMTATDSSKKATTDTTASKKKP